MGTEFLGQDNEGAAALHVFIELCLEALGFVHAREGAAGNKENGVVRNDGGIEIVRHEPPHLADLQKKGECGPEISVGKDSDIRRPFPVPLHVPALRLHQEGPELLFHLILDVLRGIAVLLLCLVKEAGDLFLVEDTDLPLLQRCPHVPV